MPLNLTANMEKISERRAVLKVRLDGDLIHSHIMDPHSATARGRVFKDLAPKVDKKHGEGALKFEDVERLLLEHAEGLEETSEGNATAEAPDDPHRLAKRHLEKEHGEGTLRYYRGKFWVWDTYYRKVEGDEIETRLISAIKEEFDLESRITNKAPRKVTRSVVGDVMGALKSLVRVPSEPDMPFWIGEDKGEVLAAPNGLFRVPTLERVGSPTPLYFSTFALDYNVDPEAPLPETWLKLLREAWPDAPDCISTLQEWFGYCLTDRARLQKILALIGVPRSGKGTIARVLKGMIGSSNYSGTTLSDLKRQFGLQTLLGKRVAVIADARLRGQTDVVMERLLSLTGEDTLTVDRKHTDAVDKQFDVKPMLMSNELPKFDDPSGATASRFLILPMTVSFLGKEDSTLTDRCLAERPGILLWALEGLKRLKERGRFEQPKSGRLMTDDLKDMASPIHAFVREVWREGLTQDELYGEYREWCEQNGQRHPDSQPTFRRNLLAAYPDKVRGGSALLAAWPREMNTQQAIEHAENGGVELAKALGGRLETEYLGKRLRALVDKKIGGRVFRKRVLKGYTLWRVEEA